MQWPSWRQRWRPPPLALEAPSLLLLRLWQRLQPAQREGGLWAGP